jgi:protease PrsW
VAGGARPTQLFQRSLFQPRQPAFWVYLAFLVYGVVRMTSALVQLSQISRSGWALSWLLLAVYTFPLFVLIYRLDLYEREPISLAVGAFLWGAFAATALSLDAAGWDRVVAQAFGQDFALRWGPALTASLTEEVLKGAGVVLIYLIARDEVDDMMDGFVYGALCGLGFAVVEDVLYFMAAFGGTPAGVFRGFYVRVLSSGLYGHVLYTGLTGMGIGYLVSRRRHEPIGKRLLVAGGLFAVGVLGHMLWDSPLLNVGQDTAGVLTEPFLLALKGLPLLVFALLAIRLSRNRERRWLDGALAREIGGEGISYDEYRTLRRPRSRRRAVAEMRRRGGRAAAGLLKRLEREQVNLAMVASRVSAADDPALVRQRDLCRSLRDALAAMPGAAPAAADDASRSSPLDDRGR